VSGLTLVEKRHGKLETLIEFRRQPSFQLKQSNHAWKWWNIKGTVQI
jgi:hypothetical protein